MYRSVSKCFSVVETDSTQLEAKVAELTAKLEARDGVCPRICLMDFRADPSQGKTASPVTAPAKGPFVMSGALQRSESMSSSSSASSSSPEEIVPVRVSGRAPAAPSTPTPSAAPSGKSRRSSAGVNPSFAVTPKRGRPATPEFANKRQKGGVLVVIETPAVAVSKQPAGKPKKSRRSGKCAVKVTPLPGRRAPLVL